LASRVVAFTGPSKLPLAMLTLALEMALRTSSRLSPADASACGLTCTRTAGRSPPPMVTRPMPGSCEIFMAMRVSTRSASRAMGRLLELTARVRIGASAGLILL